MRKRTLILATFALTFQFQAFAQDSALDVSGTNAEFEGTMNREAVRKTIGSINRDLTACYKNELKSNPQLAGKVVMNFEINDQGQVRAAKVKESTLANEKVHKCLQVLIEGQRFPKAEKGMTASIDYPFSFGKK